MTENTSSSLSKVLLFIIIILMVAFGAYYYYSESQMKTLISKTENDTSVSIEIPEKIYQLKDGSYLRLSFAVLVNENVEDEAKELLLSNNSLKVINGMHILAGDKDLNELIEGSHRRDVFADEIKVMLEEEIFQDYNAKQDDPSDRIFIKEVLIQEFVTQEN